MDIGQHNHLGKLDHLWTRTTQPFTENSTIYVQHNHLQKTHPSMYNTTIYRKLNHLWTQQSCKENSIIYGQHKNLRKIYNNIWTTQKSKENTTICGQPSRRLAKLESNQGGHRQPECESEKWQIRQEKKLFQCVGLQQVEFCPSGH